MLSHNHHQNLTQSTAGGGGGLWVVDHHWWQELADVQQLAEGKFGTNILSTSVQVLQKFLRTKKCGA